MPSQVVPTDIELRSRLPDETQPSENPPACSDSRRDGPKEKTPLFKLLSAGFSFFVAGTNDGSIGALIPYILSSYNVGTSLIGILYFTTFLGWLVAVPTNSYLPHYLPLGSLLSLGALLQTIPLFVRVFHPPFPLFALTFFVTGLGQAYQDSHANTFVSSVKGAHRWLGFIHAMYGAGLLVSPFVATTIAVSTTQKWWTLFYLFPLGLSAANLAMVLVTFRESVALRLERQGDPEPERRSVMVEAKQMLKTRDIWIFCLFFFFYLGACSTSGGWIVEFLVDVRHGDLSKVGYVPAGSYGGVFLGRLLLAEPTHRFGERRMLLLYAAICFVMQLVFWLVPNLISSIAMFSMMGFFLGPFFAAGVSVASRTLPRHLQSSALALIFVVAQAGSAIFPSLIGVIAAREGVRVLPPIVAGLIVAMAFTWCFVPKTREYED
ncbi:major facilitator superfamily domain-containing protein [Hyaloscypha sp. PMI_1271]|nr:major facilitator superfamily domain-containing protein [Hyaloscypha sp. PMI_1271]